MRFGCQKSGQDADFDGYAGEGSSKDKQSDQANAAVGPYRKHSGGMFLGSDFDGYAGEGSFAGSDKV